MTDRSPGFRRFCRFALGASDLDGGGEATTEIVSGVLEVMSGDHRRLPGTGK
jgi:hypothetical protein